MPALNNIHIARTFNETKLMIPAVDGERITRQVKHTPEDHWHAHARQWASIGSPLRPGTEDLALMRQMLGPVPGRGLLLGVTPELTSLSEKMVAVDRDAAMIARIWRPRTQSQMVMQDDWLELPMPGEEFDFAVGDGCLNVLAYRDYRRLYAQLQRQLRNAALLVVRVFAAPERAETPAMVLQAALRRQIGSFHAFKWRLAMAVTAERGHPDLPVAHLYQRFAMLVPERAALAGATGWSADEIGTIEVYRGSGLSYSFPTLAQLQQSLPAYCHQLSVACGSYELAERCPVIALRFEKKTR